MADTGRTGRILTGCGCLTWLGCVLLSVFLSFGWSFVAAVMPADLVGAIGFLIAPISWGSCACSGLAFLSAIVGIVLILMGGKQPTEDY